MSSTAFLGAERREGGCPLKWFKWRSISCIGGLPLQPGVSSHPLKVLPMRPSKLDKKWVIWRSISRIGGLPLQPGVSGHPLKGLPMRPSAFSIIFDMDKHFLHLSADLDLLHQCKASITTSLILHMKM